MSASVRVFQVDAFTAERFSGNPAGVILDADGLSAQQMQAIARELNNADSVFLLRPDADDHDLRVRFFSPRREAGFVGHATLAAHAVLAALGLPPRRRQKQASGIVEVDTISGARPPRIVIHLPPPPAPRPISAPHLSEALAALGLTPAELDPQCPAVIAGDSSLRLLLAVNQGASLAQLKPQAERLSALSALIGAPGYLVYTRRPALADVYTEARMFCPALGIPEDPVSGNAHALLGAYLWQCGLLGSDASAPRVSESLEFSGAQGQHVGRPGRVTVALNLRHGQLASVSLIGEAVVVFEATLAL